MTKKVVIYTRVSTLDQTIDNQLIELRDHCSKMGWEVVREYADEGLSGNIIERQKTCTELPHQGRISETVRFRGLLGYFQNREIDEGTDPVPVRYEGSRDRYLLSPSGVRYLDLDG